MKISRFLRQTFNFLASVYFAVCLLFFTLCAVAWATWLESKHQSHTIAANTIYHHPFFLVLLAAYFINILFSALRRYPFKKRHIGFLITHLGLLTLLLGQAAKTIWGKQAHVYIQEGTQTSWAWSKDGYSLILQRKIPSGIYETQVDFRIHKFNEKGPRIFKIPADKFGREYVIEVDQIWEHSDYHLHAWGGTDSFASRFAYIPQDFLKGFQGEKDLPRQEWKVLEISEDALKKNREIFLDHIWIEDNEASWPLLLAKKDSSQNIAGWKLQIPTHNEEGEDLPIWQFNLQNGHDHVSVDLLNAKLRSQTLALFPQSSFTLKAQPLLLCVTNSESEKLISLSPQASIATQRFTLKENPWVFRINDGFGGYGIEATLPFKTAKNLNKPKEFISRQSPPVNWASYFPHMPESQSVDLWYELLQLWSQSATLWPQKENLKPSQQALIEKIESQFNFQENSLRKLYPAIQLTKQLLKNAHPYAQTHHNWISYLKEKKWPLIQSQENFLNQNSTAWERIYLTLEQIHLAAKLIPATHSQFKKNSTSEIDDFWAFILLLDLHPRSLWENEEEHESFSRQIGKQEALDHTLTLTTPLRFSIYQVPTYQVPGLAQNLPEEKKRPSLRVRLYQEYQGQRQDLGTQRVLFDPGPTPLAQSLDNESWRVFFTPKRLQLPHTLRLNRAKQTNYPNSQLPYSFDAHIELDQSKPIHLSMNQVHESAKHWRFYLSSIYPFQPVQARWVTLAASYDPYKYYFTYPGALCISLGSFILFWRTKKKRQKNTDQKRP